MDPSGAGLCFHAHANIDESEAKRHTSLEALKAPALNGEATHSEGPDCGLQPSRADFLEEKAEESRGKVADSRGWRKAVRNFTPS